ncbi:MAG: hypothetical protein KBE23_07580 [Chloroflexi bacterium]|nr:hypothetical protein [Chloroflexota bacterium]
MAVVYQPNLMGDFLRGSPAAGMKGTQMNTDFHGFFSVRIHVHMRCGYIGDTAVSPSAIT